MARSAFFPAWSPHHAQTLVLLLLLLFRGPVLAAESPSNGEPESPPSEGFGNTSLIGAGTADITDQLIFDAAPKDPVFHTPNWDDALRPWNEWKASLFDRHGFQFTVAYSALGQSATETRTDKEDKAAGGVFDIAGTWSLFKRNSNWQGMLGFRIGDQHRLGGAPVVPADLGGEIGSAWGTALAFDNVSLNAIEGWWEQQLGSSAAFRFGKVDASSLVDPFLLGNPFEQFMGHPYNLNSTIPFASEGIGAIGLLEPVENFKIVAGIFDANGDGKEWDFDSFFDDREHLKTFELAWTPELSFGQGEYHITLWDSDERKAAKVPDGDGYTLHAEQRIGNVMPFIRYGHSSGKATALKNMISTGVGFYHPFGNFSDGIGVGFTWGEPFGDQARDQYGVEGYFRIQLTNEIAVTPDIQYIRNPANNRDEDSLFVFSVRLRAAF